MALEHYYREYEGALMTAAEYCRLSEVEHGSTELTEGKLVFLLGAHYSQHDVIAGNIYVALLAGLAQPAGGGSLAAREPERAISDHARG